MLTNLDSFRDALRERGLTPAELIADSEWHRCRTVDQPHKRNGGYKLLDTVGFIQNFADGLGVTKHSLRNGKPLTQAERAAMKASSDERHRRDVQAARRARGKAEFMWSHGTAVNWHPYLARKRVGAYGIRELDGELLVPVMGIGGVLMSLQRIDRDGGKKFLKGASTKGGFHTIPGTDDTVYFVEGYATGATVFQATKCTVIVAFDCGNLLPVASQFGMRPRYGFSDWVVAADDDWMTKGNPGVTASQGLLSAGLCDRMAVPDFGDQNRRPTAATDWNDLADLRGIREVRRQLSGY